MLIKTKEDAFTHEKFKLYFISGFLSGKEAKYYNYFQSQYEVLNSYLKTVEKKFTSLQQRKSYSPKVGFHNTKTDYFLVCADVDKLPKGYDNFFDFRSAMKQRYGEYSIVVPSFSQKAKMLFLFHYDGLSQLSFSKRIRITLQLGNDFLQKEFNEKGIACDLHRAALQYTFVNREMVQEIRSQIKDLKLYRNFSSDESQSISETSKLIKKKSAYEYIVYDSKIEWNVHKKLNEFVYYDYNNVRYLDQANACKEKFIRLLLNIPTLASRTGFDLPTTEISNFIYGTRGKHKNIDNWIKKMIGLKEIEISDEKYIPNKKAIGYRAHPDGEIYQLIKEIHKGADSMRTEPDYFRKITKPQKPANGINLDSCSFEEITNAIKYHKGNDAEILRWFKTCINDSSKSKEREETLRRLLKSYNSFLAWLIS